MDFAPRFAPSATSRFASLLSTWLPSAASSVASPRTAKKIFGQQEKQHKKFLPSLTEALPVDVLAECMSFMNVADVAHLARTCKKLYEISNHQVVWRLLCQQYFPNMVGAGHEEVSWKQAFQKASTFEWDKYNSTMDAQVVSRTTPLLEFSKQRNRIVKAIKPRDRSALLNLNIYETATSRSVQSFARGCHCLEFVVNQHNRDYRFAVGLIDAADPFNFSSASYSDGENSGNTPTSCLKQCFYWSDGAFSDIMGSCELSGTISLDDINEDQSFRTGDIIGMVVDMDASHVSFYKNYKRVCTYSFASTPTATDTMSDDSGESIGTEMHVGIYMFGEGDDVTVRYAPFFRYM